MSISTGKFEVRRDGVLVDADVDWSLGPATSSADVAGMDATVTWHSPPVVAVADDEDDRLDAEVTVDWVTPTSSTRVLSGRVDQSSGGTLQQAKSRLTDKTAQLARLIDLRPMAATLPPHREVGSQQYRRVGLHGIWFTHQAMTQAGFDPGTPMHWASVWYQSMCGSVATVPDPRHPYGSFGDLRRAHRHLDAGALPIFIQGPSQIVAKAIYTEGVTSLAKPGTTGLPWQVTVDLPLIDGETSTGEIVLRGWASPSGMALRWTATHIMIDSILAGGARSTVLTHPRDGQARWSVIADDGALTLLSDRSGAVPEATVPTSGVVLPATTGRCTVEVSSPGPIGALAVGRGARTYMVTRPVDGHILRHSLTATSLPGWLGAQDVQAGAVLADQADAHRGLRAQPLWQWVDAAGVLVNTDFDTLAAQDVALEVDTQPGSGALALDSLAWQTEPSTLR